MRELAADGQPAQCFDTHISWVIVAGGHAYKIKKALTLDFLDCSTLAARRHFCEEELRLNSRLSPDLYLDVAKVAGDAAHPRLNGAGEAVEYAVKMHAFEQGALWSRRLAHGQLSTAEADALASLLGRFHQQAAAAPADSAWGSPASIGANANSTIDALARLATDSNSQQTLAGLRAWDAARRRRLDRVFVKRKSAGMVRECHGDLHAGNILTTARGVEVFDCIEFSEALRWIDVINDVAFIWMDLLLRRRCDLASRLLNGYLTITGDYRGLAVLAYYSVHRALVRCLVQLLHAAQSAPSALADAARSEGLAYLDLAARLAAPGRPAIAITHGCSGSGKTWFSQQAADYAGAVHLRSDIERKRLYGLQASDRSGALPNSPLYDAVATRRTYARLLGLARTVVQAGMVALVDAAFLAPALRQPFARYADRAGVPFLIFDMRASPAVMARRLAERADAAEDASDADVAVLSRQLAQAHALSETEMKTAIMVDTGASLSAADVARLCEPLKAMPGILCGG
jgi:aminoglycoside phosphotransferase family enzyme/predicted kinase